MKMACSNSQEYFPRISLKFNRSIASWYIRLFYLKIVSAHNASRNNHLFNCLKLFYIIIQRNNRYSFITRIVFDIWIIFYKILRSYNMSKWHFKQILHRPFICCLHSQLICYIFLFLDLRWSKRICRYSYWRKCERFIAEVLRSSSW